MTWAPVVRVILETLAPIVGDLISALVDGDAPALRRVEDIIPETLQVEAKLAAEKARLRRLEGGEP